MLFVALIKKNEYFIHGCNCEHIFRHAIQKKIKAQKEDIAGLSKKNKKKKEKEKKREKDGMSFVTNE